MIEQHPNIELLQSVDLRDVASSKDAFSEDLVFHYFNPELPDLEGDYVGVDGLTSFFNALHNRTGGSFTVEPVAATPVGDELLVTHSRNRMSLGDRDIEIDAVVVWRFVDGRIAEAWDIPAVHEARVVSR